MSIVACVKVYDGIVFGAESMTQLMAEAAPGQVGLVKAFSNARKLFQISELPVGVLTYGAGNIGRRSIESFLVELSEDPSVSATGQFTVQEIATRLLDFIWGHHQGQYNQMPRELQPRIGFYIAGFSSGAHLGAEWEFVLPTDEVPRQVRPDTEFGASWRGVAAPFSRLFFGVDPRLPGLLQEEGVPGDVISKISAVCQRFVAPVIFDGMPVKDAIGFCTFILETTIGQATYEVGAPSCGGPLQIAVITRAEGFEWICKPDYKI